MTSTLSYNKEQLLNYYRASCPEIQEPPENLKQFPLILSTKLLQPVNETNLHLFDSDYNINPESTFPTLSTRGRGRGGRGGSRRGGGLASSGRGSSISPLVTSSLGSPSGTSSLFGASPTSLGRAGTPIGSGPRAIARSPLSLGGSRLPAWAMDEDLTQTDSSLSGLNNNSNSLLSNNSFFGNHPTSNSSLDDDTFGPGSLQPQSSNTYQPMVSLESLAAATMKMNEHWKTQMGKKPIDDFDEPLEPQDDGAIGAIDWDTQFYYLSEDNEPKGPYNLQKLKEWMDLFYLQPDTRIKQDIESHSTTTLGEVLNSLAQQNNNTHHLSHGMGNNILASQHLLSNNMKGNMHSNDFFMNDKPSMPTGGILGSLSDPFMSSQSLVKSPIQGSLLSSLDKPQPTPITPTNQQFAHPWGFGQQPMEPMVHPGYPFVNPNMPNHFMPPFHQGPGHWGNMPNLAMNLGSSNNNSIPSVTDIENELLYVQPTMPTHQEVFQHYTPIQPVSNMQEQMVVEEEEEPIVEEEIVAEEVETPVEEEEEETQIPKEEVITQETQKVDDKTSKKEKNKKKGTEAKSSNTPSKKKQELPPAKEEPVFKSVPPTETVSFAEPKKEEVKGWGVQTAVTTAPVQTLKQIMEQQKKEAIKQNKETQKKKEAAEQVIKVNTANPWGVATNAATVVAPSLKEIQEEEAKKKKQKAQKQQQSNNQASVVKNASSTWGGSTLQFKAIPEKDVPSTSSTATHFGAVTPNKTVETKSFQFQAIKPQTLPATTTSPKEEEEDQEEGGFWDYSPTPATATSTPVITTASEKKNNKKDKKKKATNEKPATTTSQTSSVTTTSNTAVEEDFPSISAKNNPFGQADVSQEFKDWFKKGLKKLNKSVDPSFMYFLLSLNSEKETIDYMSEYIGNSSAAQKFAQEFLANKSFENPNQGGSKKKK